MTEREWRIVIEIDRRRASCLEDFTKKPRSGQEDPPLREFPDYSVAPNQEGKNKQQNPLKKKSERRRAGHGSKHMATECTTFTEVTPTSNPADFLRTPDGARATAVVLISDVSHFSRQILHFF